MKDERLYENSLGVMIAGRSTWMMGAEIMLSRKQSLTSYTSALFVLDLKTRLLLKSSL